MLLKNKIEILIDEMIDGRIRLDEALAQFEKVYIEKALVRHADHVSRTAEFLGIHRNTLSKRLETYRKAGGPRK